jgi:hypothetical protein
MQSYNETFNSRYVDIGDLADGKFADVQEFRLLEDRISRRLKESQGCSQCAVKLP